ncbi:uncharacterized protein LOC144169475 [Haemaphysalis longicornis]
MLGMKNCQKAKKLKTMQAFLCFTVSCLAAVAYGASGLPEVIRPEPAVSKGAEGEIPKKIGKNRHLMAGLVKGHNSTVSKESLEQLIKVMEVLTAGEYTGAQAEVAKKARRSLKTLSRLLEDNDRTLSKEDQEEVFEIMQSLTAMESDLSDEDSEYWWDVIKAGLDFLWELFRKLFGF